MAHFFPFGYNPILVDPNVVVRGGPHVVVRGGPHIVVGVPRSRGQETWCCGVLVSYVERDIYGHLRTVYPESSHNCDRYNCTGESSCCNCARNSNNGSGSRGGYSGGSSCGHINGCGCPNGNKRNGHSKSCSCSSCDPHPSGCRCSDCTGHPRGCRCPRC